MEKLTVQQKEFETPVCAAVSTTSHEHGLAAYTVYADPTVCSRRHSKSSAWVRSM